RATMNNISSPGERLSEIARALKSSDTVPAVRVRSFLGWFFGTQRRGRWIVSYIRERLDEAGLRTVPDFESTYLDADMKFELATAQRHFDGPLHAEVAETVTVKDHAEVRVVPATFADPTYRISKLSAANRRPASVRPDSSLME